MIHCHDISFTIDQASELREIADEFRGEVVNKQTIAAMNGALQALLYRWFMQQELTHEVFVKVEDGGCGQLDISFYRNETETEKQNREAMEESIRNEVEQKIETRCPCCGRPYE